ncbi:Phosphotransferase enzyme family protein [Nonomuraea solani]|uniref:Phosphotransferase enzyme family protein n=1 Tax=Nonomuraea solani TaxID=1144553 RepID=A0A1H6D431_9ACTN|nr:phosphotransferase [Nonomuraea solani]SEG80119.1 Phosphotransferase enzyme family protein [Nonomuraea solani]
MQGAKRQFAEPEQVKDLARKALGRDLVHVERLKGGSKKGVYRLEFDRGDSAVLYSWAEDENFWDTESPSSGLRFFEAAQRRLREIGVRVPHLYHADAGREHYPADVALIEDVRTGSLEDRLARDPEGGRRVMDRLAASLRAMAECRSPEHGTVAAVESGQGRRDCVELVLGWALKDLAQAAARVERIGQVEQELGERVRELAAGIEERADYGLIHGELGPDHVLVDDQDEPVLIDIEGTSFFDVEWEHVFLRIRFGPDYEHLRIDGLDERRLTFYRLAQHLSLVAGPLRLLDGDFPDREFMMGIARHHTEQALAFV